MRANDLVQYIGTLGGTSGIFLFVCGKITRDAINPTSPFIFRDSVVYTKYKHLLPQKMKSTSP